MANTIANAVNYAAILDAKYKKGSLTSLLEVNDAFVRNFNDAGTVQLMNIVTGGLGDYNRSTGFPEGDVTVSWDSYTIDNDRAKSFQIDAMDNEETKNMVFIETARTFMTQGVIPEIDATRFARMATGGTTPVLENLGDGDAVLAAIDTAVLAMDDAEVPGENRVIYVSNGVHTLLKNASKITRQFQVDDAGSKVIARDFEEFDGMRIIKVPVARFSTAVTLGANGFTKAGTDINFQIVHVPSVTAITRHAKVRIFSADDNQAADADKYQYRIYHDLIIPANKTDGVYTSAKTA